MDANIDIGLGAKREIHKMPPLQRVYPQGRCSTAAFRFKRVGKPICFLRTDRAK
jgi:hypothetical protein